MSLTIIQPKQGRVDYRGDFREPVFGVLGNPAKLYSCLLQYLAPFGASAGSLGINLAVLAQANVTCFLQQGLVRVSLDHLGVTLPETPGHPLVDNVLGAAWAAAAATDEVLQPVRHTFTIATWSEFKDDSFGRYITKFVSPPPSHSDWKPSLELTGSAHGKVPSDSVYLAEAQMIPGGLFFKFSSTVSSVESAAELGKVMQERYRSQLANFGLALP